MKDDDRVHTTRVVQESASFTAIPAVILSNHDSVDLVIVTWTVLGLPQLTGRGMERQSEAVPVSVAVHFVSFRSARTEEWIVCRGRPVRVHAQNFSGQRVQILCIRGG